MRSRAPRATGVEIAVATGDEHVFRLREELPPLGRGFPSLTRSFHTCRGVPVLPPCQALCSASVDHVASTSIQTVIGSLVLVSSGSCPRPVWATLENVNLNTHYRAG